ncbi:Latent-transforming growth factor beta-binding protein 2 [Liparis tanakae]|uniref:Latent-transforming growth factor beta-binding protein 2 n=1 Tax=Liparis tanakae TaxID=230148 RepID=A0A4Z2G3W0_9TELE|nr:Latent-transforming growth factor beta-binding protein 2 [Liparis tanakae]
MAHLDAVSVLRGKAAPGAGPMTHIPHINECLLPGLCKNAECLNTRGSYRCTCKPGFLLDADRSHCVCEYHRHMEAVLVVSSDKAVSDQRASCYRSVSAGACSLPLAQHLTKQICCCSRVGKAWGPGYHFKEICPAGHGYTYSRSDVQISVRQLDEEDLQSTGVSREEQSPTFPQPPSSLPWLPQPPQASPDSSVIDTRPSSEDRTQPDSDVDECGDPGSCPDGVCVNTLGSFQCQACGPGYRPVDERCVDVDECGLPGVCLHGRCVNLDGGHKCTCHRGYRVTSDHKACEDVNECAAGNACPAGICVNAAGSFTCQACGSGFGPSADGLRCDDINECAQGDVCLGGVCVNTEGSYTCTRCKAGYRASPDRQRCEDVDECQSLSTCANGICLNSEGSYTCENCPAGYRVSYDGELCQDIDECALPTTCPTGTCTNTEGSFTCIVCQPGFRVSDDGQHCDDVDECSVANRCPGQLCLNAPGSYTCRSCEAGLRLSQDGYGCEDVDECQRPGACPRAVCTNTEGSFACSACEPGFRPAPGGLSCEDVDECLAVVGICGEAECLNAPGSYTCLCPHGYTSVDGRTGCQVMTQYKPGQEKGGGGRTRIYEDECSKDGVCIRGECLNTDGSFMCLCRGDRAPGNASQKLSSSVSGVRGAWSDRLEA